MPVSAYAIKPQPAVPGKDKSWLLGHLAGDGSFAVTKTRREVMVFAGPDEWVARECVRLFDSLYGATARVDEQLPGKDKRKQVSYRVTCSWKNVVFDLLDTGPFGLTRWRVPVVVLGGSDENKAAWLSGMFDADGSIYFKPETSRRTVNLTSVNKAGLDQVSKMLTEFGIRHGRAVRQGVGKWRDSHSIYITYHEDLAKFAETIGFRTPRKQEKLVEAINSYERLTRRTEDVAKHYDEIARRRRAGETHAAIAASLGLVREVVSGVCYRLGVEPEGREGNAAGGKRSVAEGPNEGKLAEVLALKEQKVSEEEIARRLGFRNKQAVQSLVQRAARKGKIERFKREDKVSAWAPLVIRMRLEEKRPLHEVGKALGHKGSQHQRAIFAGGVVIRLKKRGLWPEEAL